MGENKTITICVAENDENGNKSGIASVIDFGEAIRFESAVYPSNNVFKLLHSAYVKKLRIQRKTFGFLSSGTWTGSMAYNSYEFTYKEAAKLISYLATNGGWNIPDAYTDIIECIVKKGKISEKELFDIINS